MQENQWFMNDNYTFLQKHIQFDILVNNLMDIVVRISYKVDPDDPIESRLKPP